MARFGDSTTGAASRGGAGTLRGAYIGIVTNNEPAEGLTYRVKVKFPWLSNSGESHWARIAVPMAGKERGAYFLPEVDDQVLVVFEHGDVRRPIVVGSLWSRPSPPPERNQNGENNLRVIKSRAGHRLIFDDTPDAERVVLVDSTRKNKIVLDGSQGDITIETADGDIAIRAPAGAARLHADDIRVGAQDAVSAEGSAKMQVATRGDLEAVGSAELQLKGALVQLNPDGFGGGGGGAGGGAGGSGSGPGAAPKPRDQVREEGGPGASGSSPGGSPAARARASEQHLPDAGGEPGEPPAPSSGQPPARPPTAAERSRAAEERLGSGSGSGSGSAPEAGSGSGTERGER